MTPGERFGSSIADAGDLDGDGIPDLAVGAPLADPAGLVDAGQARIFSGSNGLILRALNGGAPADRFGSSLAAIGDLDGDGVEDLLVGAPGADPGGLADAGRATLFSGSTGAALLVLDGSSASDAFGTSVAGPGDLDGDGFPELFVGAPFASPGGVFAAGRAVVFSGNGVGILFSFDGTNLQDRLGMAVAGAGDVNGDGVADLVVGAPSASLILSGIFGLGQAGVFSGLDGSLLISFTTTVGYSELGTAVAGAGDANADGYADVIVGAPGWGFPSPGLNLGLVSLYSGQSGAILSSLAGTGSSPPGRLGSSVAGVGDVNGNGVLDYIAGAPNAGSARVIASSGGVLATLTGEPPGDSFGRAVAGLGDVTGDGRPEIAVGAPTADPSGLADAGRVRVFSFPGFPAGSSIFGTGCPGFGGFLPSIATTGGLATSTGNPIFGIALGQALGGAAAVLVAGVSSQSWGGLPLPLDLAPSGAPGCALFVSGEVLIPTIAAGTGPGGGSATVPLPVPNNAALNGGLVYFQWYVFDPGPGPLPGSMSRALQVLVL
ncbi:MAG: hypothetical protein L0323_19480 [Planctomycetes bacterium]|nr:hypothetical protein [Planctomycetota bacterium]